MAASRQVWRPGWLLALRVAGVIGGAGLALWGAAIALNEVVLHGFAVNCSDGNPAYNPQYCGVTWQPGLAYVGVAVLGLALVALSAWKRVVTGLLLLLSGISASLLAVALLWLTTWDPVTPAYPEPAGPQVVLLAVGAVVAIVGALVLRPFRSTGQAAASGAAGRV